MKFSFQTVWIIFGVTLAHLFVISALSSASGARPVLVSKAAPDPAVSPGKSAEAAAATPDSGVNPVVPVKTSPQEEKTTEIAHGKDSSTLMTAETPATAATQTLAPVESLVESAPPERSAPSVDPPAISSPPRVIREIRDLKPVRRS